jgi:molecular chaperone GrpE
MSEPEKADDGEEAAPLATDEIAELRNEKIELEDELEQEHAKAEDYLRRLQYLQAEFDNYRKRVERERDEMNRSGADRLLMDLLSVADELRIAVEVAKKTEDQEVIVAGLEMVLKKLNSLFEKEGLKPIEALGREFDPNLHEAVQRVDAVDKDQGRIVEEVRKGFTLRGKVIRSSLVKVGVAPKGAKEE